MAQSSRIPRLQLFEFHDQPWYPALLRGALTEWLRALWGYSQAATVIAPILLRVIHQAGSPQMIDLCSGGTGPMIPVQRELEARGVRVPILATDKFPDATVMAALWKQTGGRIRGALESLDATQLPDNLTGLRTLFNSFHHFGPELARQILADAYRKRQPIAVFELTDRAAGKVALSFPASFVGVFLLLFKMRPWRASWWFLTWILPVLPLSIGWDGLVSHLRTYTEIELRNLVRGMDQNYSWEIGRVAAPRAGIRIGYIIGVPDIERRL
jgi:hypothetical protein